MLFPAHPGEPALSLMNRNILQGQPEIFFFPALEIAARRQWIHKGNEAENMLLEILEHVIDGVSNLLGAFQSPREKAVIEDPAHSVKEFIDALGKPHALTLHAPGESLPGVSLHDKVQMALLNAVVKDPEIVFCHLDDLQCLDKDIQDLFLAYRRNFIHQMPHHVHWPGAFDLVPLSVSHA